MAFEPCLIPHLSPFPAQCNRNFIPFIQLITQDLPFPLRFQDIDSLFKTMIHFQKRLTPAHFILSSSIAEALLGKRDQRLTSSTSSHPQYRKSTPGMVSRGYQASIIFFARFPVGQRFLTGRDKPRRPAMSHPLLPTSLESCLYGNGTARKKFPVISLEQQHRDSAEVERQALRTELCGSPKKN